MLAVVDNPRCELCRYWSERIVRQVDFRHGGRIEAACLLRSSVHAGRFVAGAMGCDAFKPGLRAVDAAGESRAAA